MEAISHKAQLPNAIDIESMKKPAWVSPIVRRRIGAVLIGGAFVVSQVITGAAMLKQGNKIGTVVNFTIAGLAVLFAAYNVYKTMGYETDPKKVLTKLENDYQGEKFSFDDIADRCITPWGKGRGFRSKQARRAKDMPQTEWIRDKLIYQAVKENKKGIKRTYIEYPKTRSKSTMYQCQNPTDEKK